MKRLAIKPWFWCFIGAIVGLVHHYYLTGLWFEWEQIHHETLIAMALVVGLMLIIRR